MTRGAAATLRADPARQALAQLAAAYCVDRFEAAADAPKQLALLKKKTDSWQRDEFVDTGGWTKPPGAQKSVDGAADPGLHLILIKDRLHPANVRFHVDFGESFGRFHLCLPVFAFRLARTLSLPCRQAAVMAGQACFPDPGFAFPLGSISTVWVL